MLLPTHSPGPALAFFFATWSMIPAAARPTPPTTVQGVLRVPEDYPSIQEAIDAALDGDRVHVFPGIYEENIDFSGKAIEVVGIGGAQLTTIDGSTSQYPEEVVRFWNEEGPDSVIRGFTLRGGGYSNLSRAAGVSGLVPFTFEPSSAVVQDCIIRNNSASSGGSVSGDLTLERCLFFRNGSALDGGAGGYGNLTFLDCSFVRNTALNGGAIFVGGIGGSVTIQIDGALFLENYAYCSAPGGAIYGNGGANFVDCARAVFFHNATRVLAPGVSQHGGAVNAAGAFDHCTIVGNWEYPGSFNGTYVGGIAGQADVSNSIAWANRGIQLAIDSSSSVLYSDVMDGYTGTGNIDADPLFVDMAHYDFSLSPGSPCIDAGDPSFALDEDGTRTDMGAIPYDQRASASTPGGSGNAGALDPMPWIRLPGPFDEGMRELLADLFREDSADGGFLAGPRLIHVSEDGIEALDLLGVPGALVVITVGEAPLGPEIGLASLPRPKDSSLSAARRGRDRVGASGSRQAPAGSAGVPPLAVLATAVLDENGEATITLGPARPTPLGAPPAYVEAWSRSPRFGHWSSSAFLQVQGL